MDDAVLRGLALGPLELPEWLELRSFPPAKAMAGKHRHCGDLEKLLEV